MRIIVNVMLLFLLRVCAKIVRKGALQNGQRVLNIPLLKK